MPRKQISPEELANILLLQPGRKTQAMAEKFSAAGKHDPRSTMESTAELLYLGYDFNEIGTFFEEYGSSLYEACEKQRAVFLKEYGDADIDYEIDEDAFAPLKDILKFTRNGQNITAEIDMEEFENWALEALVQNLEELKDTEPDLFLEARMADLDRDHKPN